jgi:IMP dehydrogenase
MNIKPGITFDDILLIPKHSAINSRQDISLDVDLGKGIKLTSPIISANMATITELDMAASIAKFGGLPILHRFTTLTKQLSIFISAQKETNRPIGCSIGVKEEDYNNACTFIDSGCKIICIDIAHGDHVLSMNMSERIAKNHPHVLLIAGNIATAAGARRLHSAGADVIKCGIGSGALCTTRIQTAAGVPQMTALSDVFQESCLSNTDSPTVFADGIPLIFNTYRQENRRFKIISDGGIRNSGDCVKSLCFADAVMLGSVLAGTNETPGDIIIDPTTNEQFKQYAGSSTHKTNHIEGVVARVKYKGPVTQILTKLTEGIKSGLSYQNCKNLTDLKRDPQFVKVTNAGLVESHPHIQGTILW